MNALAIPPDAGLVSDSPVESVTAVSTVTEIAGGAHPKSRKWTAHEVKDCLVSVYAYGTLGFGVFFPLLLAAWKIFFAADAG